MKCQCPHYATDHNPHDCPNSANYIVSRIDEKTKETINAYVCGNCKFPEDFNVRKVNADALIEDENQLRLDL